PAFGQTGHRTGKLVGITPPDDHTSSGSTQLTGQLQPKTARTTGDQGDLAGHRVRPAVLTEHSPAHSHTRTRPGPRSQVERLPTRTLGSYTSTPHTRPGPASTAQDQSLFPAAHYYSHFTTRPNPHADPRHTPPPVHHGL